MKTGDRSGVISMAETEARIPGPAGERVAVALKRGTLDVTLSVPVSPNRQTPHKQDEIYFIIRGRGVLVQGDKRDAFVAGDVRLSPRALNTITKISVGISRCGASSMESMAAKFQRRPLQACSMYYYRAAKATALNACAKRRGNQKS